MYPREKDHIEFYLSLCNMSPLFVGLIVMTLWGVTWNLRRRLTLSLLALLTLITCVPFFDVAMWTHGFGPGTGYVLTLISMSLIACATSVLQVPTETQRRRRRRRKE